ncbi:MAG: GNAT family N-acetyltransferase [Aristaeellaceae bacterium]
MTALIPAGERAALRLLYASMPCLHGLWEAGLDGTGRAWADAPVNPRAAVMAVGDFLLCGGEADAALLRKAVRSARKPWLVYGPDGWLRALESVAPFRLTERQAFLPEVQPEDGPLRSLLARLPEDMRIRPLEGPWIPWCRLQAWSRDFVSQFTDAGFAAEGLGMLVMREGQPVSGASAYVRYPGGLEVQVTTREDCQGRGYATLASAALILRAHALGLAATWDAANPVSAHIARKLGYRAAGKYTVAEINEMY